MTKMPAIKSRLWKSGGIIDLTGSEETSSSSEDSESEQSAGFADRTAHLDSTSMTNGDHMHQVVSLLTEDRAQTSQHIYNPVAAKSTHSSRNRRGTTADAATDYASADTIPLPLNPRRLSSSIGIQKDGRKSRKEPMQPFPFMEFPPEIRNAVYRVLLTTPNVPIEFHGLTGRNGAKHREQWAKCKTSKSKGRHKKLFLEILEVCKQIHNEASGIIYGCNVFKYRSDPASSNPRIILPTRHLQLLKHIKVSVISRYRNEYQYEWVATIIREFLKDGLKLETFELTWFGWSRCYLKKDDPVCEALRHLQVERQFVVKIAGEARMNGETQQDLERSLVSKRVEIHRPMRDNGGELSDEETFNL